jgi:hypothetical protein
MNEKYKYNYDHKISEVMLQEVALVLLIFYQYKSSLIIL